MKQKRCTYSNTVFYSIVFQSVRSTTNELLKWRSRSRSYRAHRPPLGLRKRSQTHTHTRTHIPTSIKSDEEYRYENLGQRANDRKMGDALREPAYNTRMTKRSFFGF